MKTLLLAALAALCIALPAQARIDSGTITAQGANCADINAIVVTLGSGTGAAGVSITGTWTGTITFQVSIDGSQFTNATGGAVPFGGGTAVNSTTANGQWRIDATNVYQLCMYGSAAITGTAHIVIDQSQRQAAGTDGVGFNGTATAPRYCDKQAAFTTLGTTATVQQIAGVAGQNIWICGYTGVASTATAGTLLSWKEGTGSNCGTGTAAIGGSLFTTPTAAPTSPNLVLAPASPAVKMTASTGDSICLSQASTTNSTTLSGLVFYTITP